MVDWRLISVLNKNTLLQDEPVCTLLRHERVRYTITPVYNILSVRLISLINYCCQASNYLSYTKWEKIECGRKTIAVSDAALVVIGNIVLRLLFSVSLWLTLFGVLNTLSNSNETKLLTSVAVWKIHIHISILMKMYLIKGT